MSTTNHENNQATVIAQIIINQLQKKSYLTKSIWLQKLSNVNLLIIFFTKKAIRYVVSEGKSVSVSNTIQGVTNQTIREKI